MAKSFRCRLITPDACVLDDQVTYASVPAWDGLFGVLPGRAPIVAKLGLGELRLDFADSSKGAGGQRSFLVEDGFVQMVGDKLTILASKAIPTESIDLAGAKAELTQTETRKPDDSSAASNDQLRRDRDRARIKVRLASGSKGI